MHTVGPAALGQAQTIRHTEHPPSRLPATLSAEHPVGGYLKLTCLRRA
jgi:hypothetical protein